MHGLLTRRSTNVLQDLKKNTPPKVIGKEDPPMKTFLFVVDKLLYSETEKALSESKAFVMMFPEIIFIWMHVGFSAREICQKLQTRI